MNNLEIRELYLSFKENYYKNYIEEMKELDKSTRQARMRGLYIDRKECKEEENAAEAAEADFLISLLKKSGHFWEDFKEVWDTFKPREYAGGHPYYHSGDGARDSLF